MANAKQESVEETRAEAAANGHVRYIGSPCRKCGEVERYTSYGGCVACNRENAAKLHQRIRKALREAKGGS